MPNFAKSHSDCLKSVCFLCMKKSDRELTDFMKARINNIFKEAIDFCDEKIPTGVCNTCRLKLQKIDDGSYMGPIPQLFNFQSITVKPGTRSSTPCLCLICQIAKTKLKETLPTLFESRLDHDNVYF